MKEDIAPKLWEAIQYDFLRGVATDRRIIAILDKIDGGTALLSDAAMYAKYVGEHASGALRKNFSTRTLPDGKMYWNIVTRTVLPLMKEAHRMINDTAAATLIISDKKQKIGIKPVRPAFPADRVNDLMNRMVQVSEVEND